MNPQVNKKGFTLVELMIVIAIIAFLSSIIITNLTTARKNAYNAVAGLQVREYVRVLERFLLDNNYFPNPASAASCLGHGVVIDGYEVCFRDGSIFFLDSVIQNALAPYIPSLPSVPTGPAIDFWNDPDFNYQGAVYECLAPITFSGGIWRCVNIQITWPVYGSKCNPGTLHLYTDNTPVTDGVHSVCRYRMSK